MTRTIKKLVIIPDVHVSPKYDNERLVWLARYIKHEKPEVVVCLGDFADMPSLSSYDRGKATFEGRRYNDDVVAVRAGLRVLESGFGRVTRRLGRVVRDRKPHGGRRVQGPEKYMLLGNHEARISRAANDNPELKGFLKAENLGYSAEGWRVTGYRRTLELGGITFSHDFPTGISGKSIGGENIARSLIQKNLVSSVQGHSHVFDHSERTRIDGTKLFGLSAGCYTHPDMVEDWNISTHHMWWRGVVSLEGVEGGYYDKLVATTMKDIKAEYGRI